jgi:hypothetical protein
LSLLVVFQQDGRFVRARYEEERVGVMQADIDANCEHRFECGGP